MVKAVKSCYFLIVCFISISQIICGQETVKTKFFWVGEDPIHEASQHLGNDCDGIIMIIKSDYYFNVRARDSALMVIAAPAGANSPREIGTEFVFSKDIYNLEFLVIDLDGVEFVRDINPPFTSISDEPGRMPFYSENENTAITSRGVDDTYGRLYWEGPLNKLSFTYHREGGLLLGINDFNFDYYPDVYGVEADFSMAPSVVAMENPEVQFTDLSTGATEWFWDFGDGNSSTEKSPGHKYEAPGIYDITLIVSWAENGECTDTITQQLEIFSSTYTSEFNFYIPNSFTPNADGVNDYFHPIGSGIKDQLIQVYDRWGAQVYEGKGPGAQWDGTIDGKQAHNGLYFYKIEVVDIRNDHHYYSGNVTLFR